jgi:hypothetical protein
MKATWLKEVTALTVFLLCAQSILAQNFMEGCRQGSPRLAYSSVQFQLYQVRMPDGVKLSAAVWRPDVENERFPIIMVATPYNKLAPVNISTRIISFREDSFTSLMTCEGGMTRKGRRICTARRTVRTSM